MDIQQLDMLPAVMEREGTSLFFHLKTQSVKLTTNFP
jgi:hypothetical protein